MLKPFFIIATSILLLSACSKTFPVTGSIKNTGENFVGTATSVVSGTSRLEMTTEKGIKCTGQYKAPPVWNATQGVSFSGTISCSDGRTGKFNGTGTIDNGRGFGQMSNGDRFQFVYGQTSTIYIQR